MFFKNNSTDRRSFMRHLAQAGMLIPFTYGFLGRQAWAASGLERVVFVYYPNGALVANSSLQTLKLGRQWHPRSQIGTQGKDIDLSNTCLDPFVNASFNGQAYDLRNDMVFLRNMLLKSNEGNPKGGGSHSDNAKALWFCNNSGEGESIDAAIAKKLGVDPLLVGIHRAGGGDPSKALTSAGEFKINPHDTLNYLKTKSGNSVVAVNQDNSAINQEKLRLLDYLRKDLQQLENLSLNAAEQDKIEQHKKEFDALEKRLSGGGVECNNLSLRQLRSAANLDFSGQINNWTDILQDQIDLAVDALACGITKVVDLRISEHTSEINYREASGIKDEIAQVMQQTNTVDGNGYMSHPSSHLERPDTYMMQCRWVNQQMAYLLAQLKYRNLLDSTVVIALSECGDATHYEHNGYDGGWWLAGGSNVINAGQVFDVADAYHSRLLADIANAMGTGITNYGHSSESRSISGLFK